MVHQMSGEPESVILGEMSFARGLQYQNQYFRIVEKRPLYKPNSTDRGLHIVL